MRIDDDDPDWVYRSMLQWRRRARWQRWVARGHMVAVGGFALIGWWIHVVAYFGLGVLWYYIARDSDRTADERIEWIVQDEAWRVWDL